MSELIGTPKMIKLVNKDLIEEIIKEHGPITKPEIAKITNLSLVTVNKTVKALLDENKIKESGINESTGGRRAQSYEINAEIRNNIGLFYYKNKFIGAISNSIGEIIYQEDFPVRVETFDEVMEDIYKAIDKLIEQCRGNEVTAIGIGVPGVVNKGCVSNIPNIPSWEGINVASIIEDKYKVPILLENDINLTAMGAYYSDYKDDVNSLVLVYLEQGIGSGIILNKELFKGATNFSGELSYLPIRTSLELYDKKTKYKGNFENIISYIYNELEKNEGKDNAELKNVLNKTIVDGLLSIICILNPEIIILNCNQLTDDDICQMVEMIKLYINEENIPKIIKIDNLKRHGIQGVINMCIRETLPIYSLSSRKRG